MRIIFMGTPEFAIDSLEILLKSQHEVIGVVTVADKPAGRGKQLRSSPIKIFAEENNLPVFQPIKLKDPEFIGAMEELAPDLMVVVAFRMLPKVIWSIPKQGTLNLHAALLPDYRGAAPINWVIINGEKATGLTSFMIDEQIDTGGILLSQKVAIPYGWNAGDLHDSMKVMGANLILRTVNGLADGSLKPVPQDHSLSIHPAPKIKKEDCKIDWTRDAKSLYNFIRGLSPYPTSWTVWNNKPVKIYEATVVDHLEQQTPGSLQAIDGHLYCHCGTGALEIKTLQMAGKKRMTAADFLRGFKGELDRWD